MRRLWPGLEAGSTNAIKIHRPTPVGWGNPNYFTRLFNLKRTSPFTAPRMASGYSRALADDAENMDTEAPSPSMFSELTDVIKAAAGAYKDYSQASTQAANQKRLNAARAAGNSGFISGLPSGSIMGIPTSGLLLAAAGLLAYKLLKK
jgi:hypothetical protein